VGGKYSIPLVMCLVWSNLGTDGFRVTKLEILLSPAVIALILKTSLNNLQKKE
jgi:hypothetical protein